MSLLSAFLFLIVVLELFYMKRPFGVSWRQAADKVAKTANYLVKPPVSFEKRLDKWVLNNGVFFLVLVELIILLLC
jgi:hypothetical protein